MSSLQDHWRNKTDDELAQAMGQKGKQIVATNKGALQRLLVLLEPLVNQVNQR